MGWDYLWMGDPDFEHDHITGDFISQVVNTHYSYPDQDKFECCGYKFYNVHTEDHYGETVLELEVEDYGTLRIEL